MNSELCFQVICPGNGGAVVEGVLMTPRETEWRLNRSIGHKLLEVRVRLFAMHVCSKPSYGYSRMGQITMIYSRSHVCRFEMFWNVEDLYSTDSTQEACPRWCRLPGMSYGWHHELHHTDHTDHTDQGFIWSGRWSWIYCRNLCPRCTRFEYNLLQGCVGLFLKYCSTTSVGFCTSTTAVGFSNSAVNTAVPGGKLLQ